MFCQNCGAALSAGTRFCPRCGTPAAAGVSEQPKAPVRGKSDDSAASAPKKRRPSAGKMMQQGARVTENIYLCEDGKYRWVYEMPILKNPTIFILVWKIFFFIILGIFVVMTVIDLIEWGSNAGEILLNNLKFFGYFMIGMAALIIISLLVYAAVMGGKYIVMFEMDEKGVNHRQIPKQVEKAEAIGFITALAGIASGNITTVGVGLTSASRTEMYSEFNKVRAVRSCPRRHLIKVNERFKKNQVYADPADYDFVLGFIRAHAACEQVDR